MKRSKMPPRGTYLRTRTPMPRVNRARKAKNSLRAYGPAERRDWLTSRPCIICGKPGPSEQAHVETGGTGRKANADKTIPACHDCHQGPQGMHAGIRSFEARHGVDLQLLAAAVERAWQRECART